MQSKAGTAVSGFVMALSGLSGLEYGPRLQASGRTRGTVFPNTDRPRPVNNIFIYF